MGVVKLNQELGKVVTIGPLQQNLYYKFDYDSRSFDVNMEFQHFHDFYEIFIPLEEDTGHLLEGEMHHLMPLDIVMVKSGVLHKTYYPPNNKPKKRLIINFFFERNDIAFEKAYAEIFSLFEQKTPIYRFEKEVMAPFLQDMNHIFELSCGLSKEEAPLTAFAIHHLFMGLLYKLYVVRHKNRYEREEQQDSLTSKIYAITSFIHHHYEKELSLQQISEQFFMSPYYLSHQFKKVTGFTLVQYIQMTRIKNAQQLLLTTDLNITVIADLCGFTSFSQFNRVFNKFCETSPSKFRRAGGKSK